MRTPVQIFVILLALALLLAGCITLPAVPISNAGNEERGARLFAQGQGDTPPCSTCHQTVSGQVGFSVGPNLAGIGERAGMRVEGLPAEEDLYQSMLEPGRYIVPGYRNMMYPDYDVYFREQDVRDLIAYLLTL
jgi:cytochrome c2